jgi:hypothetical protein
MMYYLVLKNLGHYRGSIMGLGLGLLICLGYQYNRVINDYRYKISDRYVIFCVHYLCLIGWVYLFYVGHVDGVVYMKPFSTVIF